LKWRKDKKILIFANVLKTYHEARLFEVIMSALNLTGLEFFIFCDFNLRASYISPLIKSLNKFDLIQIVIISTRNDSLLDLVICRASSSILNLVVNDTHLADHKLTEITIDLRKPKPPKITMSFRQFSSITPSLLLSYLSTNLHVDFLSIETHTSHIQQTILALFDKLAPLKTVIPS
jgi:hypothetical protein